MHPEILTIPFTGLTVKSYGTPQEAGSMKPKVIVLDGQNRIVSGSDQ